MSDLKQINLEKINGSIDDLLIEISNNMKVRLDREKFEFLRLISKTKYSGYTLKNLMTVIKFLQNKHESWFNELIDDGLAETFVFKSPNGKYEKWDGWFVTQIGKKVIKEVINKM